MKKEEIDFFKTKLWREVRGKLDWIAKGCKSTAAINNLKIKKRYRREE